MSEEGATSNNPVYVGSDKWIVIENYPIKRLKRIINDRKKLLQINHCRVFVNDFTLESNNPAPSTTVKWRGKHIVTYGSLGGDLWGISWVDDGGVPVTTEHYFGTRDELLDHVCKIIEMCDSVGGDGE